MSDMTAAKAREIVDIGNGKKDLTDEPISIREYERAKGYLEALTGPEVQALLDECEIHGEAGRCQDCLEALSAYKKAVGR